MLSSFSVYSYVNGTSVKVFDFGVVLVLCAILGIVISVFWKGGKY